MAYYYIGFRLKCRSSFIFVICWCLLLTKVITAEDNQDLEPFEPFAFELEADDEIGFTSNHKHALIGTQRPLTESDESDSSLNGQFPINSEAAKVQSLVPDTAKLKHEGTTISASQEFQRDSSHEKVNNDRIVTSTEFLLDPNLNTSKNEETDQPTLCESPQDTPTFIKHSRVLHTSLPKMSKKMDSLSDCAANCRNKMAINGEESFDCQGFSFFGLQDNNKCEFYENHAFNYSPAEKNQTSYFERICLPISRECSNIYSFEIQPERFMAIRSIKEQTVENRKQCLDLCLESQHCRAVNHNRVNGTCQLLDKFSQNFMMSLVENEEFDYYENMCIQDRQRCENGYRMDFVVTKNTQVSVGSGLDISLGSLSVANCMRSCIESTLIYCRSFQYDPISKECLLAEETGANAVRSDKFDLYEPTCLNNEIDVPCTGDRVFERIPKHNLISDNVLAHLKDISLGSCMEACLFDEKCLSFTYHRPDRRCKIMPLNRRNNQTLAVVETAIDYYELACDRKLILKNQQILAETAPLDSFTTRQTITTESDKRLSPTQATTSAPSTRHACDISQSVIIENGRTLRIDFRNLHHVNVHTLERCQKLCAESSIICATFAFNQKTLDCLLSSTRIDKNNRFALITQPNPNFDLYSFLGSACNYNETTASNLITTTTSTSATTQTTELQTSTVSEFTATMFLSDPFDEEKSVPGSTLSTHPTLVSIVSSTNSNQLFREPKLSKLEPIFDADLQSKQTTKQLPVFTTPSQITRRPFSTHLPSTEKPTPIETVITSTSQIFPHRNKTMQRLPIQSIHVKAICLENGVNVTFQIENNLSYTGAVYAAERFSQCRVFVDSKDQFSLFVTRPSVNSFCNALEEDGELTAVLVFSNDMVLPFDVTTKDDLYFQVSCDYNKGEENFLVKHGIVVGGPEPRSVASAGKKDEKPYRVSLKILKNNHPVNKVYIGEKLTAMIETDIDVSRLRVTDCNATRVGGHGPRPNAVQLIKDGCTIMPQIIGNIVKGQNGLEAPFTAFRIDGSDQIDIVCGVILCKRRCDDKIPQCPTNRNKRDADEISGNEMIIDQRLQVLVNDDKHEHNDQPIERNHESLLNMILDMDGTKSEFCASPLFVLIFLLIFLCMLIAFCISLIVLICRRRSMRFPYSSHSQLNSNVHIPRIEHYTPGSEIF